MVSGPKLVCTSMHKLHELSCYIQACAGKPVCCLQENTNKLIKYWLYILPHPRVQWNVDRFLVDFPSLKLYYLTHHLPPPHSKRATPLLVNIQLQPCNLAMDSKTTTSHPMVPGQDNGNAQKKKKAIIRIPAVSVTVTVLSSHHQ